MTQLRQRVERLEHLATNAASVTADANDLANFPGNKNLVAGANITLTPGTGTLTIAGTGGGGGGQVDSVVAGDGIDVDATDPINPIVSALLSADGGNTIVFGTDDGLYVPAGTTGTVTSVGVSTGSSGVSVTGSPVTTSGTIDLDLGTLANVDDAPSDGTTYGRLNGAWAAAGGGSPGGSTTQIQYNNAGVFAGSSGLTWNEANQTLSLTGTDAEIEMAGVTNEPASPVSGNIRIYAKAVAGRMVLKAKGPSGVDSPLQNAFWQNNITMWNSTSASAGVWLGTTGSGSGTYTTALPTDTNLSTSIKRGRWANVVTTANQVLGQRGTQSMFYRGGAVSGAGGFFMYARGGFDVFTSGGRFFCGMATGTTVISGNPSSLNNTVGFCVDSTDGLAISFLTRGTSATKAATGFSFATTDSMFDFYIFCAPGDSQYGWRIVELNSGSEASGVATLNLPSSSVKAAPYFVGSNAALTPVTSVRVSLNRIYVETDT